MKKSISLKIMQTLSIMFGRMAFVKKRGLYLNNHGKIIHKDFTKSVRTLPCDMI